MPDYNFHSVFMAMETLLVECNSCSRRVAMTKEDGLPIWQGNMTPVRTARLKCRCGCTDVRRYIPISQDQIDFFLAGDPRNHETGCLADAIRRQPPLPVWIVDAVVA